MRRILSVLLENESGALSRVVGLFSQRGYNIESLNVAPTDDHSLSRLTVTTTGDDLKVEQVTKQLNKIIDVVKVVDLTEGAHVERDTLLVKVRAEGEQRDEVKRTTESFEAKSLTLGRPPISCSSLDRQISLIRFCKPWVRLRYWRWFGLAWQAWREGRRFCPHE